MPCFLKVAIISVCCVLYFVGATEIKREPTYVVVAPSKIYPNQLLKVSATVLKMEYESFTVTAIVRKLNGNNYDEICSTRHTFTRVGSYELTMQTQEKMSPGNYTMRVAGYSDSGLQGQLFSNDTELFFDPKEVSIFIQLSKPFYRPGQTVRFRVIPLKNNLKAVSTTMDVRIKDPNGFPVREFFSQHTNTGGVVSLTYPLSSNLLAFGDWTVEVFAREHLYNKTFRVYEFYDPLFYVNVTMPTIMFKNSRGISGIVASNHTTGRGTKGSCVITLELFSMQDKEPVVTIARDISYFDGRVDFFFSSLEMGQHPNNLVGKEVKVTAAVLDWFYNTTAIGYQSAVVYDEDVQLKFLGGNVWSFKPNLPFEIHIAAVNRDGSPLSPSNENRTINLVIKEFETASTVDGDSRTDEIIISKQTSVAQYWLYPKSNTRRIVVEARYMNKQDTLTELAATRFWSPNDYFLQLTTNTKSPTVGQYMIFNVQTNAFIETIYYHIVAAGNIIVTDTLQMYSRNKLFSVALSREMAPSARIIAYFVAPDGQMVADSHNFHVNGSGLHEMSLRFNRGKDFTYNSVEITATADPLAYVAFSAMEYQLYELGARNGLTWEEVYQELYTYDSHANTSVHHYWLKNGVVEDSFYAPTPSFAHDVNSTFFYAGLYVYTDANASAVFTRCNKTLGEFPCMDGLSCYDHKHICNFNPFCGLDWRDEMGCKGHEIKGIDLYNNDTLWRTRHIMPYFQDGSFLWEDQFTKPDGRIDFKVDVPTFPTTWVVAGFSMSMDLGLAILPIPTQFDGVRPMYITVEGTPHAKTGEHFSLRVAIFNFWTEDMDILVSIPASDDYQFVDLNLDSASENPVTPVDGAHQLLVPVFPGSNRQVFIPIRARRFGHLVVPVTASCVVGGHTVNHHVFIDHSGVQEHYITNRQVDLTIANSERLPDFYIPVKEAIVDPEKRLQNYIPGSPKTTIYVIGDIVGISFFPYAHYDLSSENLLRLPYGSGSEAVFNFAVNLYTLKMLRALSSSVSNSKLDKALYTLNIAMQEMMFYMQEDGSFKEFRWSDESSTWLTAMALDVLSEGRDRTSDLFQSFQVPAAALSQTAIWLSERQNNITGHFTEVSSVYNKRFQSTIDTTYTDASGDPVTTSANMALTAACVVALAKAPELSKDASEKASEAYQSGALFLENHVRQLNDPFELAITLHALYKTGRTSRTSETLRKLDGMSRSEKGLMYWSTQPIEPIVEGSTGQDTVVRLQTKQYSNVTSYAVAATSYALLSHMDNTSDADTVLKPIQKFLQEQHMWIGGFSSTQDTLVAMQALKILAEKNQDRPTYEMTFTFKSDQAASWTQSFTIDQSNWFDQQLVELPTHWGSVQINVKGHGVALVQMKTTQNHEHLFQLRKPFVENIFLLGDFAQNIRGRGFNTSYVDYNICPSYTGADRSGMSVLEIGIPSGYVVHNSTLQAYVKEQKTLNSSLRNAEFYNGKAVFYFNHLDMSNDVNCAKFSAERWYPVANISEQHMIRVFEYYEPGNFNYSLYQKIEFRKLTVCLVCGSYQCPYCPHYASASWTTPNFALTVFTVLAVLIYNQSTRFSLHILNSIK